MAGAGYKLFNTGDVLTAAQVNTYLMEQTVMVFADATARTTALSGVVAEGMLSYLKSTKQVEVYNGSAWVASDDPNAIQNTIVDAKGDLITATAADVPARLAVGTQNQVLTVDSTTATGLKWAAGAWTTWSPSINNVSIGNGTITARYTQIGNTINFSLRVIFGSTTTISGSPNFLLPVISNSVAAFPCWILDQGVAAYFGSAVIPASNLNSCFLDLIDTTSNRALLTAFSSTSPFTWGNTDSFHISGSYEVA